MEESSDDGFLHLLHDGLVGCFLLLLSLVPLPHDPFLLTCVVLYYVGGVFFFTRDGAYMIKTIKVRHVEWYRSFTRHGTYKTRPVSKLVSLLSVRQEKHEPSCKCFPTITNT
jgi:hypothetical protein